MKQPLMAIIQARMGSSRLPGKSLRPVCGKPLIFHVIERLQQSNRITEIVLATSMEARDAALAEAVTEKGIRVVRGSESDVLSRFVLATEGYEGNYLVRVTGDAPFVDAAAIDRMAAILEHANADFFYLEEGATPIHEGFEVFSTASLRRLANEAKDSPVAREHVTGYFKMYPDFVKSALVTIPEEESFKGARMSVDTPKDIAFVESVYHHLGCDVPLANIRDVVQLLQKHPSLLQINANVYQKKADDIAMKIICICQSSATVGYGHLSRMLALSDVLRNEFAAAISLYIIGDETSTMRAEAAGFAVTPLNSDDVPGALENVCFDDVDGVVIDVKDGLSTQTVKSLQSRGIAISLIDDGSERRMWGTANFYPASPQVDTFTWPGYKGSVFSGFRYAIVDPVYFVSPQEPRLHNKPRLLISMGGSDPHGFTKFAVEALSKSTFCHEIEITLVLGSGFNGLNETARLAKLLLGDNVTVEYAPPTLRALLEWADTALISFGVTAYEVAAMMIPAVYVCLSEDHRTSASAFVNRHMGIVGATYPTDMNETSLCTSVEHMIRSWQRNPVPVQTFADSAYEIRTGTRNVANEIIGMMTKQK